MTTKETWQEVTKERPCPICKKSDWCRVSVDGSLAACRRESRGGKLRRYGDGSDYYLHVLRDDRPQRSVKPASGSVGKRSNKTTPECAEPATLDKAYRLLLGCLDLSPDHRDALHKRGLSDADIERGEYKTLPDATGRIIKTLRADLGDEVLLSVPGLLRTKIAAPSGLLVPIRNVSGQIIALKVRLDKPTDGGKYLYLSSRKRGGPGPGSPVHVPAAVQGPCERVRITEGELKADVSTARSDVATIAFPGIDSWRKVLPVLQALQVKIGVASFDADATENPSVAKRLLECVETLPTEGYAVELERWDAADGKGIDDLLAAGKTPDVLCGDDALQAAREIAESAGVPERPTEAQDEQTEVDRIGAELEKLLNAGGVAALYRDTKYLERLANLAVQDPPGYAVMRDQLRAGEVKLRDFDRALKPLIDVAVKEQPADFARGETGGFFVSDGCICRTKYTIFQPLTVPLCNFAAEIVDETVRDDGAERQVMLGIRGKLAKGRPLPRIEVRGESFPKLDWVVPGWGSDAIVWPGESRAMAPAIQALSDEKKRRTVFCHTGWRHMGGRWVYLHAGGAIGLPKGDEAVSVDLQPPLHNFILPHPNPAKQQEAIRASLRLLGLGPDQLTCPVLAATYRAAVGGVDFSLHMAGASGVFKSEVAALSQQHFGPALDARHLPGSWSSTGNALEYSAFLCKDAVFVVDDFAPTGSSGDVQRFHREADRLLRAQGNQTGRQRMRADGSLRPVKPPRGLILSTGEDTPRGQSLRARVFALDVAAGDIDPQQLTDCQRDAAGGLYAQAMAGFIEWLAPRYPIVTARLAGKVDEYRAKAAGDGYHARTPGIVAELAIGWFLFLQFASDAKAITHDERDRLFDRGWQAFIDAANAQAHQQTANEPAAHFVRLLTAAIASGRAHVATIEGAEPDTAGDWGWRSVRNEWQSRGDLVGWLDGESLYLEPDAAYAVVQRLASSQNEMIAVSPTTLRKRLRERGYLAEVDTNRQTLTVRRTIGGTRREVLSLRVASLSVQNPTNPTKRQLTFDEQTSCAGRVASERPDQNSTSGRVGGQVDAGNPTNATPDATTTKDDLVGLVGFATEVDGMSGDEPTNTESDEGETPRSEHFEY